MAKPMFSYYGAKWQGAKHYGSPRHNVVIEPFAGSACYSLRWNVNTSLLYDASQEICDLWDFLINCSDADIRGIPDVFNSFEEIEQLNRGANLLVRFWVAKGRAEPTNKLSPWYQQYRNDSQCRVWGGAVKKRIIAQKPIIKGWKVDSCDYQDIPDVVGHWHIDPPYNNNAGSRYPYSGKKIDYNHLSKWCKSRRGSVDVCENVGATWLPFTPLYEVVSCRGRRDGGKSLEAIWRNTDGESLE